MEICIETKVNCVNGHKENCSKEMNFTIHRLQIFLNQDPAIQVMLQALK